MTTAPEMERALAELRRRFRERARSRLGELETLVARLEAGKGDEADRRRARRLAHELAGGAGSFGYPELGREAAALEALLRALERGEAVEGRLGAALRGVAARIPTDAGAPAAAET